MENDKQDERGILLRIISNPDIQKGFVFFALALILAFSAVITTVEEDVDSDTFSPEDHGLVTNINYPRMREIDEATLEIRSDEELESEATIRILDSDYEPIFLPEEWTTSDRESMDLSEVENISLDLTLLDEDPRHFSFNVTEGSLTYTYTVSYPRKPYGLLSLPAALFTLIGMVYAFKGKGAILGEIKRRQMEKETEKMREKKEEEKDEDKEISEDVIYEGTGSSKKGQEAEHINFMGVPDDSEEEKEG